MPLISLHKYISVYENNRLFRKPPLPGPPLSCAKISRESIESNSFLLYVCVFVYIYIYIYIYIYVYSFSADILASPEIQPLSTPSPPTIYYM